jgi:Cysteine rich repeat
VPVIIGVIPPRKKLMIVKNCRKDLDAYCAGVDYGEGRQLHCLLSNKASLSPGCQGALAKLTH